MRSKSYLCSSFHPRRALPPRAPLRFCHIAPLPLTPRKTATTPQAEACGVASAYPRSIASEAGLAPSGFPAVLSHHPSRHGCSTGSDNPAGRSLRGCLRVSAVHCIRGGPCPLGLPCGSISSPSRHGCSSGSDNPAGRSLRGCLSMTLQAQQSVFLNWDAGELRLGQITPTALPSSRQTAS